MDETPVSPTYTIVLKTLMELYVNNQPHFLDISNMSHLLQVLSNI